ncbi:hypothetical protein [Escherichia coli]|uniref:hypothetical protein n=1 Tax=Escherichia coli TaxID=562 RepID=UPI003D9A5920
MAVWLPLSGTSYGIAGLLMLAVSPQAVPGGRQSGTSGAGSPACWTVIPALNLATSDAAAVAGLMMTVLTVALVSCAQGNHYPVSGPEIFSRRSMPVIWLCWAFWHCDGCGIFGPLTG